MTIIPSIESARASTVAVALMLAGGGALLGGCEPLSDNNGNIPLAQIVEEVEPGQHTRDDVATMLGNPSTRSTFHRDRTWYYIGKRTETLAFFTPKVLEHKVVEIRFDDRGVVEEVKRYDATTADKVDLVERTTPTRGNEMTLVEQLVGNIGRFNPAAGAGGNDSTLGGP